MPQQIDQNTRLIPIALIKRLIERGSTKQFALFFQKYHEADIADAIQELPLEDRLVFFRTVKPEVAVEVLEEMDIHEQGLLIQEFKSEFAAKYIEEMEPDLAADLLEELLENDAEKVDEIIRRLPKEDAKDIKKLLTYEEDSAGAIMTSEFLAIPENLTSRKALEKIKEMDPPDSEVSFYIYIVDDQGRLVGFTTLRNLIMASPQSRVKTIRNENPISANVNTDQEEVAKLIQKYDLITLPIVDDKNVLVGLVTVDDIVDVVVEEATEDLYRLSGTSSDYNENKLLQGNMSYAVRQRTPWLILTIFGGILASYIITFYSTHFHMDSFSLALSLSFVPLLMGLGGNVGNQSATIMVRGLSTGQIKDVKASSYIIRETSVGFLIGASLAIIMFISTILINKSNLLASIISASIITNITVAALIGSSLPIILKKLNIDPAIASAPFISTTLDIIGQLIYFALTVFIITWLG